MCMEPCPPRGAWGYASLGKVRNLHSLTLLLVASGVSKLATDKHLSIQKISASKFRRGRGGGEILGAPLCN